MPGKSVPHFATLTIPFDHPRAPARHSDIEQVFEDVFIVRGRMLSTPSRPLFERLFMHYSRTMTIVRSVDTEGTATLTLFNSIRLDQKTEERLGMLGRVKHIVRLGSYHGVDDGYYLERFDARYWIVDGMESAQGLNRVPGILSNLEAARLPVPDSQVFRFTHIPYPEAIYLLTPTDRRPGVAITADAIQNHDSPWDVDNSLLVSLAIKRIGLLGQGRLGPLWLREQAKDSIDSELRAQLTKRDIRRIMCELFRPQYEDLVANHDFDALIPGHGEPLCQGARDAIKQSIANQLSYDGSHATRAFRAMD